ncbi:hypothetical protein, partial [Pseudomonas syringae]|uniref:hypothetical protein n=1 Tax=Pseudomonas syringae TaxID=317 RepID=UPI001E52E63D
MIYINILKCEILCNTFFCATRFLALQLLAQTHEPSAPGNRTGPTTHSAVTPGPESSYENCRPAY